MRTLLALLVIAIAGEAFSHGGGLDKNGCHTNRKTGDYHCHRGGPAAALIQSEPSERASSSRPQPTGAFRNCDAARAAGAAPISRGEPGYGSHLDRDNDGIACEPYRERR